MSPTPPHIRQFPAKKRRAVDEHQPFSAEEQARVDEHRPITGEHFSLINALGLALRTWLADRPHVRREDVQVVLDMGSTLRQWLRDHPQVTTADIEVALEVLPNLLGDPDEDIVWNLGWWTDDTENEIA
jgi:hypothetical protein